MVKTINNRTAVAGHARERRCRRRLVGVRANRPVMRRGCKGSAADLYKAEVTADIVFARGRCRLPTGRCSSHRLSCRAVHRLRYVKEAVINQQAVVDDAR